MTVVLDASVAVAALADAGDRGRWARELLGERHLVAPHLLPVEVTSTLRRLALAGTIDAFSAGTAVRELTDLGIELYPFEPFAPRVWALRATVTAYDACYVAVAEASGAPLATLDERLAGTPGLLCEFVRFG